MTTDPDPTAASGRARNDVSAAAADAADPHVQLRRYRASIDNIDAALVHLLAERFKITQDVGVYKAAVGLPAADPEREEQQIARLRSLAEESGLDPVFTEKFLRFIVAEVIHHHQRIAETGPA
jgi:chorismate mutase